jgi:hypothetical protein
MHTFTNLSETLCHQFTITVLQTAYFESHGPRFGKGKALRSIDLAMSTAANFASQTLVRLRALPQTWQDLAGLGTKACKRALSFSVTSLALYSTTYPFLPEKLGEILSDLR